MEKTLKKFPSAPRLRTLIGPSFLILAMGLGSGEVILWPYMVANYGLGIVWGAVVGLTFQFFINMEIERYALVRGESVFVGLSRLFRRVPYWFIISTFFSFGLPGIVAASAQVLSSALGWESFKYLAIFLLLLIGLVLSAGKTIYGLMERTTKTVIMAGVPFVFLLVLIIASRHDWSMLVAGLVGRGEGFHFLPEGISLATFLAAFAYSGAGGNLNLTQSIYIKEKGYGMGKYAQKIQGLFRGGKQEEVRLAGPDFSVDQENVSRFRQWWRLITKEHFMVFWTLGLVSILLLMLMSYSTVYGQAGNEQGILFVIREGTAVGQALAPWLGLAFLGVIGLMLFQTQLGVMDSTSRIMSENYALLKLKGQVSGQIHLSRIYYYFLWSQIAFGIFLFLIDVYEPKTLIVLAAILSAVSMFVHIGLVYRLNRRSLPAACQASPARRALILGIFCLFGVFSAFVIATSLF